MHNFKDIDFPESDSEDVIKSLGCNEKEHIELFTKFMESTKGIYQKSRVIKKIIKTHEFTDAEMKLIFTLAYTKAVETIEKKFKK